jgi:hypothetical protein
MRLRLISDAMLAAAAARLPDNRWRRAIGRRAARRALHAVALAAAPDDPVTLAILGLYTRAAAAPADDAEGRIGRLVARAALGEIPALGKARGLPSSWQRRLSQIAAPADYLQAAALAPTDLARAACLYVGDRAAAELLLAGQSGREADVLAAGIALARGDQRAARRRLNAAFVGDGLVPPLADSDAAIDMAAFGGSGPVVADGPLVSVIMPLHENAGTVEMAIASLLAQTYRRIEVIAIDDRSTDQGPAIAARTGDPRVRVLANAGPPGVSGARNTGIAASTGAYVTFLDADDWAHPQRIARQLGAFGREVGGTVGQHFRIDRAGMPVAPRVWPIVRLCAISLFARRGVLTAAGPFEDARTGSDAELLARLDLLFGRRAIRRDPAILTVQLWREGSLSHVGGRGLFSPERYDYRAAWMDRHLALWRARRLPMPLPAS